MDRGMMLRVAMTMANDTSATMAEALGVQPNAVSRWRRGFLPLPKYLSALADRLGWSDAELGAYVRAPQ